MISDTLLPQIMSQDELEVFLAQIREVRRLLGSQTRSDVAETMKRIPAFVYESLQHSGQMPRDDAQADVLLQQLEDNLAQRDVVEVMIAIPPSFALQKRIMEKLEKLGRDIVVLITVRQSVLGGATVFVSGRVADKSLKSALFSTSE